MKPFQGIDATRIHKPVAHVSGRTVGRDNRARPRHPCSPSGHGLSTGNVLVGTGMPDQVARYRHPSPVSTRHRHRTTAAGIDRSQSAPPRSEPGRRQVRAPSCNTTSSVTQVRHGLKRCVFRPMEHASWRHRARGTGISGRRQKATSSATSIAVTSWRPSR